MFLLKIAPVFFLALAASAEKKIELQDIEEDNLKSEKETELEKTHTQSSGLELKGLLPLDFLKYGLKYFERPTQIAPQQRYVHQYAVTEPPERPSAPSAPSSTIGSSNPQFTGHSAQGMVGYLSNVPMQIYLVPQYYSEPTASAVSGPGVQYASPSVVHVAPYSTPEPQTQPSVVEVPAYVAPSGKSYVAQYTSPVSYVTYHQPTVAPVAHTATPVLAYPQFVHYPTAVAAPPVLPKSYQHQRPQYETNSVDENVQENEDENTKQYETQSESPQKQTAVEYPRHYLSKTPVSEDYRHNSISELPAPNPLLLRGLPSHLAHLPKALPMYRPLTKPVYAAGGGFLSSAYAPRPSEFYGIPRRRPNSLLESYIPSSLSLEYMKRGYTKDSLQAYEALSNARHYPPVMPRQYERGFLPNQMYHTAAGGVTFGHYKRTPKLEKSSHS